jgi:hypothetical protein
MKLNIAKEVAAREQMTVEQRQQRYVEVFGEPDGSSVSRLPWVWRETGRDVRRGRGCW